MDRPAARESIEGDIDRLVHLHHNNPHALLGVHPDGEGVVLRTYRPDATNVEAVPEFGGRIPLKHRRDGIWEGRLNGKKETFPYLLEVTYPGGAKFTLREPYAFLPTFGEMDLHLVGEGRHERLWERMGAHPTHHHGISGVSFAVWAPTARGVSVVGDFNGWDGRLHPMRQMGPSGVWELFVPEIAEGTRYKFEIRPGSGGPRVLKSDPFAFRTEVPPLTASVVHDLHHFRWSDSEWMKARETSNPWQSPMSIYEVHLGSWRRKPEEGNRSLTYVEQANELADYVKDMGFTHVELMPVAEHPFGGSWGYQVGGYYSPTARFGHPDDLRTLIDAFHRRGLGIIVDWVPGHFPKDAHGLGRFDGTALYEHADPRQGDQPDWGTYVFNFGRNEVRNFLIANALFWIEEYHVDGLRVDAVASMLYLDYSRKHGEWVPNEHGGRENLESIAFMKELNSLVRQKFPGVSVIAEESTAWPKVSQPVEQGGLGYGFKWNMGWMHDTLSYYGKDPVYRSHHHHNLTFGFLYAFSENFVLPLSHDEVVHGKGSLYGRMPGDAWQKSANLRNLFGWMWAHPGKKLVFMGGEFGQPAEWNNDASLDWHLLDSPNHRGIQSLVRQLNKVYATEHALFEADSDAAGFQWLQADARDENVFAFFRKGRSTDRPVVCIANMSPVPRHGYRVGVPRSGAWSELVNTDAAEYGGSNVRNAGRVESDKIPWDGQDNSVELVLPPLGVLWLTPAK